MAMAERTSRGSRRQSGFTLIELMIVIAVIGILAAVAIPQFMKALEKSKYTSCVTTLTNVKTAVEMYMSDFGKYLPQDDKWEALGPYMVPGCNDRSGNDSECRDTNGKHMIESWLESNCLAGTTEYRALNNYDYEIRGQSDEGFTCKICVTPAGFYPPVYDEKMCQDDICP